MRAVEVGLECRRRRGIVEVNVEEQLLVRVGKTFAEFTLDGTVAGTDVILQHIADNFSNVLNFCQFESTPVVQKLGALGYSISVHASSTRKSSVVESTTV